MGRFLVPGNRLFNVSLPFSFMLMLGVALLVGGLSRETQAQSFTTSTLQNVDLSAPTSLQFGPDGRLYVSQQDGTILAVTVQKNGANDYSAVDVETINLIKSIPNHNDDGTLAPSSIQGKRQVTGIYVTSSPNDASLPVLYVGSSDPRIGAGTGGDDTNLDTNSGIITRLTYNGTTWSAVDLVRGLPRSEENHATNGLQLDASTNTLLVAQGGHTNAGAPSNNFALTTEYALSAAILSVDLDAVEALPTQTDANGRAFKYNLPTLNDPARTDIVDGSWSTESSFDETRHENAFVEVNDKFYVLGGRETTTTRIYDPSTQTWSTGATMPATSDWPTNLHHFQAVELDGLIYIVGALTGGYPNEPAASNVYVYDPTDDTWSLGPEIPTDRRRGSAGAAVHDGKIYFVGGNAYGHTGPGSAKFDMFDPAAGTFTTLPEAPRVRDHFFATVVGDKLYAIAGRESDLSDSNLFNQNVPEVDVYDFTSGTWSTLPPGSNLPTPRSAPGTALIDGEIIVAGGESEQSTVHAQTEAFDLQSQTWRTLAPMKTPRHGTQAIAWNNQFYIVAGSPNKGGAGSSVLDLESLDLQTQSGYTDPNDPFGGNDGLNQAKIDPTGPVQIYSPGWRNAYDLVLTASGNLWVVDNGPNPGWGGHPLGEADYPTDPDGDPVGACTNDYDPNEPGSTDSGTGGDPKVNNKDNLHVVTQGYYGGHPTPVRGNLDAGVYVNGTWLQPGDSALPSDWAELVPSVNAVECDYRNPGETDGALVTWDKKSVNGIAEYTGSGDLQGDLLLASLNDGTIKYVDVDATGTGVVSNSNLASGLSAPLDVTVTGETSVYPGVAWVATYGGGGSIAILEPDIQLVCDGTDDNTIDEDGDGYTNADEIDNGTNLCSASDVPANNDVAGEQAEIDAGTRTFFSSDLNDPDDDNDTVADLSDPFQTDGSNGTAESLPVFKDLFLGSIDQSLAGGVGFTGLMQNGTDDYFSLYSATNLLTGGATGQFSIIEVGSGTADNAINTQENGFQFGFEPISEPYTAQVQMVGPYFNNTPEDGFEQGFYLGTGSQDDYAKIVLSASSDFSAQGADGGIEVIIESSGATTRTLFPVDGLIGETQNIDLMLMVDPAAASIQPAYNVSGASPVDLGTPIPVSGTLLDALQGSHAIGSAVPSGTALGVITTTNGASSTFQADFEFINVRDGTTDATPTLTPVARLNSGSSSSYTDTEGQTWDADSFFSGGKIYSVPNPIEQTEEDALYQTERWGDQTYEIPLNNGVYTVRLHFAELYWGVKKGDSSPGQRIFNVYTEGTLALDQYDILAATGAPLVAIVEEVRGISVSDGSLTLAFEGIADNAKISAIEVLEEDGTPTPAYTVATTVTGSGSVSLSPDQPSYEEGTVVDLTATPAAGWEFVEWTGDVAGTSNPTSITVNGDITTTAIFQEITPQYVVNASVQGNGVISKDPDQELYDAGTTVELTAVPDAGWYFAGWSGEVTGTQNPLVVTLNADYVISAAFEELPTTDAFIAAVTAEDASGRSIQRSFGVSATGTDGFDSGIDVEAPPAPPSGAFDARFVTSTGPSLFTDIRASASYPGSIAWTLEVQGSESPISLTWDASLFPPGEMVMTSSTDGSVISMKTQTSVEVGNTPSSQTISYTPYDPATLASVTRTVDAGWDLWGLSYDVGAIPYQTLLPLAEDGSLLGFDGAYNSASRAQLGRGYWINYGSAGTITIDGYPVQSVSVNAEPGWNLITGPSCSADLPASVTVAYAYTNGSYQPTTTTVPFQGTWVKVSEPTTLSLDCGSSSLLASKSTTSRPESRMTLTVTDAKGASQVLHITGASDAQNLDAYSLPPRPPQAIFDARFDTDNRMYSGEQGSVQLQSTAYPIRVSVSGDHAAGTATERSSTGTSRSFVLRDGATFEITDPTVSALALSLPASVLKDLPLVFELHGNYPNPFRDATQLAFDLPEDATISIEVFNILGQRVLRIEDQRISAGIGRTIPVRGSWASGVYFYRIHAQMSTGTITKTDKMVVVR